MKTIKPIPTQYNGVEFRSRLEARWAWFFDRLGVEWEYEKEGYDIPGLGYYVPDFWLPNVKYRPHSKSICGVWLEIKPPGDISPNAFEKVRSLPVAPAFIVGGNPKEHAEMGGYGKIFADESYDTFLYPGGIIEATPWLDGPMLFSYCPECNSTSLVYGLESGYTHCPNDNCGYGYPCSSSGDVLSLDTHITDNPGNPAHALAIESSKVRFY